MTLTLQQLVSTKGLTFQITYNINFGSSLLWSNISNNLMIYYFSKYCKIFQICSVKLIFSSIFSYINVIFPSPFYALTFPLIFQCSQIFSSFSRFSLSAGNPEQAKKTALCKECQISISYREESLHPDTGENPKTNTYKHKHAQTLNIDKYKKNQ